MVYYSLLIIPLWTERSGLPTLILSTLIVILGGVLGIWSLQNDRLLLCLAIEDDLRVSIHLGNNLLRLVGHLVSRDIGLQLVSTTRLQRLVAVVLLHPWWKKGIAYGTRHNDLGNGIVVCFVVVAIAIAIATTIASSSVLVSSYVWIWIYSVKPTGLSRSVRSFLLRSPFSLSLVLLVLRLRIRDGVQSYSSILISLASLTSFLNSDVYTIILAHFMSYSEEYQVPAWSV